MRESGNRPDRRLSDGFWEHLGECGDGITRRALLGCVGLVASGAAPNPEIALPALSIHPQSEHIYGISYEARGGRGSVIHPASFTTYDARGGVRQQEAFDGHGYGLLRLELDENWQTGRVEAFTKAGASNLVIRLAVKGGAGAEVRNVKLVEGGFEADPPIAGPPYLNWINSLTANREIAKSRPLLTLAEDGDSIWTSKSRRLRITNDDAAVLAKEVRPYLELPPERLYKLMPERRGFNFTGSDRDEHVYRWDPRDPDVLRLPDGQVFDYVRQYPLSGYEEVRTPSGKVVRYPFHDPAGKAPSDQQTRGWEHSPPSDGRVYLDGFMTDARIHWMLRAAYIMAALYRETGDTEYGLRAGAILGAFARALYDYPIFGRVISGGPRQFQAPDAYHLWMSYILHDWYLPWAGRIRIPVRTYDLIRDAPFWTDLGRQFGRDLRADIEAGLMHAARLTLKYDAYFRIDPWRFFHNTMSGELTMFVETGRALGCPELVHYALRKIGQAFRYNFMADGMFPESTSYIEDMVGGFRQVLKASAEGYSDPPGFTSRITGKHIASLDPRRDVPLFSLSEQVLDRLRFPDGSAATIHDTWTGSQLPRPKADLSPVRPFLLPDFGHAILGGGTNPNAFEAHLHYSGYYNHGHQDALNLTLWAYGSELTADVGYDHQGAYKNSTTSHNLVVVNSASQNAFGVHRGDLMAWRPTQGGVQIAQAAADPAAYPMVSRYRRTVIAVPFAPGQDAVVDLFEVRGGNRHEWMVNGSADSPQSVVTDLPFKQAADNLALDGQAFARNDLKAPDPSGRPSDYYGAFRNARFASVRQPWQMTMSSGAHQPGLRLNWVCPSEGEVILCEAPRGRFPREREIREKVGGVEWARERMKKLIVRRDGSNLESMFAAVWEPFHTAPWITQVNRISSIAPVDGIGIEISAAGQQATILYRTPESQSTLITPRLSADTRFAVLRQAGGERMLDLYDGREATVGDLAVKLHPTRSADVISVEPRIVVVATTWTGRPDWIRLTQEGHSSIWLPVERLELAGGGVTRVVLTRDCGLVWDAKGRLLRERAFPHRTLAGGLRASLPDWARLIWNAHTTRVHASGEFRLEWKGQPVQMASDADGWSQATVKQD